MLYSPQAFVGGRHTEIRTQTSSLSDWRPGPTRLCAEKKRGPCGPQGRHPAFRLAALHHLTGTELPRRLSLVARGGCDPPSTLARAALRLSYLAYRASPVGLQYPSKVPSRGPLTSGAGGNRTRIRKTSAKTSLTCLASCSQSRAQGAAGCPLRIPRSRPVKAILQFEHPVVRQSRQPSSCGLAPQEATRTPRPRDG